MPHPARLADDLAAGQSATHAPVPADWHSFRHFLIDTTCCLTIKRSCVWKIRYSSPHGEGAVRAVSFVMYGDTRRHGAEKYVRKNLVVRQFFSYFAHENRNTEGHHGNNHITSTR